MCVTDIRITPHKRDCQIILGNLGFSVTYVPSIGEDEALAEFMAIFPQG
jgi:hypothetical protein